MTFWGKLWDIHVHEWCLSVHVSLCVGELLWFFFYVVVFLHLVGKGMNWILVYDCHFKCFLYYHMHCCVGLMLASSNNSILDSANGSSYVVLDADNSKASLNKNGQIRIISMKCIIALTVIRYCLWNEEAQGSVTIRNYQWPLYLWLIRSFLPITCTLSSGKLDHWHPLSLKVCLPFLCVCSLKFAMGGSDRFFCICFNRYAWIRFFKQATCYVLIVLLTTFRKGFPERKHVVQLLMYTSIYLHRYVKAQFVYRMTLALGASQDEMMWQVNCQLTFCCM